MLLLLTLLCLMRFVACDPIPEPSPHQQSNWPWSTQNSQSVSRNYFDSDGWPNGDARGEGWGPSDSGWGPGSSGSGWGSSNCVKLRQRPRCVPSILEIEQKLLSVGQKMSGFCSAYSDRPLREVYGVDNFKLRVRLTDFTEYDVQVRVRQRLVTIVAKTCSAEYAALRILPDVVDSRHGSWRMHGHVLTVMFPYSITPDTEIQSRCGREFDPDPIIVPKCAADAVVTRDYDVSFNDANLRRAIRRYLEELERADDQYVDLG